MKLDTKEQHLRDQLGLMIPYTDEEIKTLKTKQIEVKGESETYYAEFVYFKRPTQIFVSTWIEV